MMNKIVALLIATLSSLTVIAQSYPGGICGTDDVDIEITRANIAAAEAFAKTYGPPAKGVVRYIPIRVKVTGNTAPVTLLPSS